MNHTEQLIAAAKAQDLQDLLEHIAWTDVVRPRLQKQIRDYADILVGEALGGALPPGKTREQIAGMAYGLKHVMELFERILRDGERALVALQNEGIAIHTQER